MAIRSRDFVGKAEGIKSHEVSLKSKLEQLENQASMLRSRREMVLNNIASLEASLEAAYEDTDEDGEYDSGRVAAISSRLSVAEDELLSLEGEINSTDGEIEQSSSELSRVQEEKAATLFEIKERAMKTSQNISNAAGMYGNYASVGANLQNSFQNSLNSLSHAASILGGSVAGAGGASKGRGSSSKSGIGGKSVSAVQHSPIAAFTSGTSGGSDNHDFSSAKYSPSSSRGATSSTVQAFTSTSSNSGRSSVSSAFSGNSGKSSSRGATASTVQAFTLTGSNSGRSSVSNAFSGNSGKSSSIGATSSTVQAFTSTSRDSNRSSVNYNSQKSGDSISNRSSGKSSLNISPAEALSMYMNMHNYGKEDYKIYSKDPEWKKLHDAVYQGTKSKEAAHTKAYNDYNYWSDNGGMDLAYTDLSHNNSSYNVNVPANNIFGILDSNSEGFWAHKSNSKEDYIYMAKQIPIVRCYLQNGKSVTDVISMGGIVGACAANYFQNPVQVMKYGSAYIHCNDGRHRTVAAQLAGVEIPVSVVQEYHYKGNLSQTSSNINVINSDSMHKRTPSETENFTENLVSGKGYINGNKFAFKKIQVENKSVLCKHPGNQKGDQKPDKYKFDEEKKTLYIIEDKNYGIEKNIDNLINNIVKQSKNRIDNCFDVYVPKNVLNNVSDSYVKKMNITFSIDVKGHYFHQDGTPVKISELNKIKEKVLEKLSKQVDNEILHNVNIRIGVLFDSLTNKMLDIE
ncbi:MAG: hypothetical protein ACI4XP_03970 [Acutalibacteraceae bacterium]